jgi:glutathione S-transferase
MYVLYAIPGSHACRAAALMLEHKQLPYRRVDLVSGLHPLQVRRHGFDSGGETRNVGGRRTLGLRVGDRLGTVPGLACGPERISTNHAIARYVEERHPEPPLLPADPERRAAVEEVERWANAVLQMDARRVLAGAVRRDPAAFSRVSAEGRLGPLLFRPRLARRLLVPQLLRVFPTGPQAERRLLGELPAVLDRIDGWIAAGVLGGAAPNLGDFMVAPSLALMLYRADLRPLFAGRPTLALVDRLLPEAGA